jgi:hypothetical protein
MYLEDCLVFINEKFNQNWLDEYLVNNSSGEGIELKETFESDINAKIEAFSDYFIKSIITGEYINEVNLNENLSKLKQAVNVITSPDIDNYNEVVYEKLKLIRNVFEHFIDKYIGFEKIISSYNSNSNSHLISKLDKQSLPKNYKSVKLQTFKSFIDIYIFEHFLSEDQDHINIILNIENETDKFVESDNDYYQVYRTKVAFLKFKLLYRFNLNIERNKQTDFTNKIYLLNNEVISLNKVPTNSAQNEKLKKWEEYLIKHYSLNINLDYQYFEDTFKQIKCIPIEERNVLQLHFCIKYFKDIAKDKINLIKVVEQIEKNFLSSNNDFVYSKIYLYALNNLFSFYCDTEDSEIENLFEKIESIQKEFQNKNFFSSLKLLQYYSDKLFNKIEKQENLLDIDIHDSKKEFDKIEKLINQTKFRIDWSDSHHNLVFQLNFSDSLVDINILDSEVIKVYFPSSFVLPIALKENVEQFENIERKFQEYKLRFELYSKLQPNIRDIKDAKDEIKKIENKSIEQITIFTAIISFIVGSIGAFQFIESFSQAVLFIVIFSVSISIFVLLIFTTTKGLKALVEKWYLFIPPYLIVGLIVYFIILPFYKEDMLKQEFSYKNEKIIQRKLDSIQRINIQSNKSNNLLIKELNLKVDSLKFISNKQNNLK